MSGEVVSDAGAACDHARTPAVWTGGAVAITRSTSTLRRHGPIIRQLACSAPPGPSFAADVSLPPACELWLP